MTYLSYLVYLTPILFNVAFVFYTKWQIDEMIKISQGKMTYANAPRKWHPYGGFMRAEIYVILIAEHLCPSSLADIALSAFINIPLWDILINVIALHVKWNYEGTTAATDRKLGKIKWYTYAGLLIGAATWKFLGIKKKTDNNTKIKK